MRLLKAIGLVLVVLLVAFLAFFFWASSATHSEEAYAAVTTYDAPPAAPRDTITVMTYNIGYLSGMTNNLPVERTAQLYAENLDDAAALIRRTGADVIAFQEIDFGAARSYDVQQLDTLARLGGYAASAAAVNWDENYVPFPSASPAQHFGRMLSGQAVLSRFPIQRHERVVLQRPENAMGYPWPLGPMSDRFYIDRLAQIVELDVGRPLLLINVHLEAFATEPRQRQAEELRVLFDNFADDFDVLVVGDFNTLLPADKQRPDLPEAQRQEFAGDTSLEALLRETTLRPALPANSPDGTYPADAPAIKIDHIFYESDAFEVVEAYVVGGEAQPSDHRAVVARLVFKSPQP